MIVGVLEVRRNDENGASVKTIILRDDIQHVKAILGTDDGGKTFYSEKLKIVAEKKDYEVELDKNTSFTVYHSDEKEDETNDVDIVRQTITNILLNHDDAPGY